MNKDFKKTKKNDKNKRLNNGCSVVFNNSSVMILVF